MSYKLSYLNPIRFHQSGIGDFAYNEIPAHEFQRGYNQVYFHGDRPWIQVLSATPFAAMFMKLIDNEGTVYKTWQFYRSGYSYGAWFTFDWVGVFPPASVAPAGVYFLKLEIQDAGGSLVFYSEPISLVASQDETLKIVYTHDLNEFDTYFTIGTGVNFLLRVEGGVKSEGLQPGGKFTMFQDLDYQSLILQAQPYNVEKFTFGPSAGIPNHLADKLNRIFSLSSVTINGTAYTRNEGAKMERNGETDYPLAGWSLELVKTANPYSDAFSEYTPKSAFTADNTLKTADTTLYTADQTEYLP